MTMFGMDPSTPGMRGLGSYANPHHTIAMRDIPTNIKQVMRLCRFYFNQDSMLGALTEKMSEYPITAMLIEPHRADKLDTGMRERWEYLVNVVMNLRQVMININVDKFLYGNSFHYMYYPFVRYCVDKDTGARKPIASLDIRRVMPHDAPNGFTFDVEAYDADARTTKVYSIVDVKSEARSGFKLIRWSPLRMTLKYNPTSGAREWQWTPPSRMKDGFLNCDRTIVDSTEMAILEAIYKDRRIKVNESRLWVAQSADQPDLWEGWGVPPLFRVLEDVYYYKLLRRANEALAQEHITPVRFLSPRGTGDVSPQRSINLSDWQAKLKRELQRFKADPNHVVVSPIPVEVEQMGGNARVMMVASEMEGAARTVAAGVGCPVELIWGGLNWSGASVSLRVLENHFINMREDCERLLGFLAPKLASYFRLVPVKLSLAEFRMADDVQHQANAINLMIQGFLSRESVIGEMNYDPQREFDRLEAEHARLNQITMKDNVAAAHMNTVIGAMEAKAQILLQYEMENLQTRVQAISERERLRVLQDHVRQLHAKGVTSPAEFDQSAQMLQRLDPNMANMILQHWMQTMPNVTRLLMAKMGRQMEDAQMLQQQQPQGAQDLGAAEDPMAGGAHGPYAEDGAQPPSPQMQEPMPEQRPPRRAAGGV